ncbi:crotonobetainyl-CoA:carnitine CoA-transferase CaiB-like acyl-CoA transferase [Bradyrhizobium sp. USDA 4532]|uniref:CaiB/BaiF CoA transferase family protein n=1 Tax=unclassified Bradyrhizobium TaxID=2631580 RepID=UPI00209E51BF|nr:MULTISPECIES: CaiB/BaiF CoA-transferase family protein [unclassified Bradyrhizobium]MCP1835511.1 crotonobetainyl-CoA:carnitine CoA-transferase CaiB-like acyl-CoA transferase [Bradyrhizobium sp. USDA 4545]MCP1920258.1 crotonobetainyl-CoA:carnitine CoA-transferase CaiB-like acyl-CoA transferase [Bradyrhizobium sp. USDA 4532]
MGVLDGMKVVEMGSLGPVQMCGMLLADLGADVIVVERSATDADRPRPSEIYNRGKRSIAVDLNKPGTVDTILKVTERADALIEGMGPGMMERLGLGPDVCLVRHPSLVYGRVSGFGHDGPLSRAPGFDSTFISLSGALWLASQPGERPDAPLTLLGDVGGGALYLALGVLAGVLRAREDKRGQVVEAAIVDGSASLLNLMLAVVPSCDGRFEYIRSNGYGRHFVRSYRCSDGEWIRVESVEPKFYTELIKRLGLNHDERFVNGQNNRESWSALSVELDALFATKTRAQWRELLEGTDACFGPVLSPPEAAVHPHNVARAVYTTVDGILQAAPAPRFSATPSVAPTHVPVRGAHTSEVLSEIDLAAQQIEQFAKQGELRETN